MTLTKEELAESFCFSQDGSVRWRKTGNLITCQDKDGYVVVKYKRKQYRLHRLIHFFFTGEWPDIVDHRDCDRTNNNPDNLRSATKQLNSSNSRATWGATPYRGVIALRGKFRANVRAHGRREHLGFFDTAEEAYAAYLKRRTELNPGVELVH